MMPMEDFSAGAIAMTLKICSRCHKEKNATTDFYISRGITRAECKKCTIQRNVLHQRKTQSWKTRFIDKDSTKSYMIEYYKKNKEKFAEYRRKFKERNPDYYRDYAQRLKNQRN